MMWLAVHFPNLALEIFGFHQLDTPAVVLEDQKIHSLNEPARQMSIIAGSTLATAHSICPGIVHAQRDTELEQQRLTRLAEILYGFSAQVSLEKPQGVVLEIGGSLKLFGNHKTLSQKAQAICRELGHDNQASAATTPRAAIALSRAPSTSKTWGMQAIRQVPLQSAGLELAGVDKQVIERLSNMGIQSLGPLLDLPASQLGKRFGKHLLAYIAQLKGDLPDPRINITPAVTFDGSLHLLQPLNNIQDLLERPGSPMQKLLRDLEAWLIAQQLGCEQLNWVFSGQPSPNTSQPDTGKICMPINFARARQQHQDMLRICHLKMEQIQLPDDVMSVSLQTPGLQAWNNQSDALFNTGMENAQHNTQQLEDLIDELHARLGDGVCSQLQTADQHIPENAWRAITPTQRKQANSKPIPSGTPNTKTSPSSGQTQTTTTCGKKRPLWLFNVPQPVSAKELKLLHGPERIQTQWWSPSHNTHTLSSVYRDYYIARHRQGLECWAFMDSQNQWYLHGYFG